MSGVFTEIKEKDQLYAMVPVHIPQLEDIFDTARDADKARVFLQHLFVIRQRMQDNQKKYRWIKRKTRWCPASSRNLEGLIHDYARIAKILIKHGIIEMKLNERGTGSYEAQKVPLQYRVVFPKYLLNAGANKYRRETITTKGVIKSVGNYYRKRYQRHRRRVLERSPWLEKSIDFIDDLYLELPDDPFNEIEGYTEKTDKQATDFINGRGKYLVQDHYGGRFYSQIVSLPKILRPYLRHVDGSQLILLDIKGCQPYLLSALFFKPQLLEYMPKYYDLYPKLAKLSESPSTRLFYEHCADGSFYKRMIDASGLGKKEYKDQLFGHVFYASLYKYHDKPQIGLERWKAQRLFWSAYTDPFRTLLSIKSTRREEIATVDIYLLEADEDYRLYSLPQLIATTLEVEILLNRITRRCLESGLPLTTIHDAVLLREQDTHKFLDIYNTVFFEMGLIPPAYEITPKTLT